MGQCVSMERASLGATASSFLEFVSGGGRSALNRSLQRCAGRARGGVPEAAPGVSARSVSTRPCSPAAGRSSDGK